MTRSGSSSWRSALLAAEFADPDVREFARCYLQVVAEQKQSDPADWSADERAACDSGNWRAFSRLRGYTEDEIANYGRFIELAGVLDARYGEHYSQGFACALSPDA